MRHMCDTAVNLTGDLTACVLLGGSGEQQAADME